MDLQQIVVLRASDGPVLHQRLQRVADPAQIESLVHAVHVEPVGFQILDNRGRAPSVISDHQRVNVILLDQVAEPSEAVPIIHHVVAAGTQQPPLDHDLIGNTVPIGGLLDLLAGEPEMAEQPQRPVLFDHHAGARQVRRLAQVQPAQRITLRKILKPQIPRDHFPGFVFVQEYLPHGFGGEPGGAAVLLQVAILTQEFQALADGSVRDVDLAADKLLGNGFAQARQALPQLVDVVPLVGIVDHVQDRQDVLLPAVPVQECRPALHQLVEQTLVLISAG